jgi:hypothetical protein
VSWIQSKELLPVQLKPALRRRAMQRLAVGMSGWMDEGEYGCELGI